MKKPMLTKREVDGLRDYVWSPPVINTIEAAVELLEGVRQSDLCGVDQWELQRKNRQDIEAFLNAYHGTSDKERQP